MLAAGMTAIPVLAATPPPSRTEIMAALRDGRLTDARTLLDTWLSEHPTDGVMLYNASCVAAGLGLIEDAERLLLDAVRAGFMNFSIMSRDPDLDPIRRGKVLRAILDARNAADDVIASRRIRHARERFGGAELLLRRDFVRRLDYLTDLADHEFIDVEEPASRLVDYVTWLLFEDHPIHRVLIIIPNRERLEGLFASPYVRGEYRHAVRELLCDGAPRTLCHELVHALHHAFMDRVGQEHPIWIQEGLACLFESISISESGDPVVYSNERHHIALALVRSGQSLPWRDLFAMDRRAFDADSAETYALARSLFEFMHDVGLLSEWWAEYISNHDSDESGALAVESAFGAPLADVEECWRQWLVARAPTFQTEDGTVRITRNAPGAGTSASPIAPAPDDRGAVTSSAIAETLYRSAHPIVLEEYAARIPALAEVVALDPAHASARYDLGLGYIIEGDIDAAARQRDALASIDSNLANLLTAALQCADNDH